MLTNSNTYNGYNVFQDESKIIFGNVFRQESLPFIKDKKHFLKVRERFQGLNWGKKITQVWADWKNLNDYDKFVLHPDYYPEAIGGCFNHLDICKDESKIVFGDIFEHRHLPFIETEHEFEEFRLHIHRIAESGEFNDMIEWVYKVEWEFK